MSRRGVMVADAGTKHLFKNLEARKHFGHHK